MEFNGFKITREIPDTGWSRRLSHIFFDDSNDFRCVTGIGTVNPRFLQKYTKRVIFNDPATIVIWADKTKTVVKCCEGDTYDKEKGLMACIIKKMTGNTGRWNEIIKEWVNEDS